MIDGHRPDPDDLGNCRICKRFLDQHSKWPVADIVATIVGLTLLSVMFAAIILARASS